MALVAILLTGCASGSSTNSNASNSVGPNQNAQQVGQKSYTLQQVAQHNTATDCWTAINGNVYDVTSFIPQHPGGQAIVQGCGQDATALFAKHPPQARAILATFQIGVLAQ